jgi:hypothetical protein
LAANQARVGALEKPRSKELTMSRKLARDDSAIETDRAREQAGRELPL